MAFGFQTIYELATGRSSKWPKVRDAFLAENPTCAFCGRDSEVVHHITPVAVAPALEMEESNWIAVCHDDHWDKCHDRNWRKWVVNVKQIAKLFRESIRGPVGDIE